MYLLMALVLSAVGRPALALLMRVQLDGAGKPLSWGRKVYNQLFTMHGTTMIFFVLTPTILGFSVYLTPLMIGANEMAFPRLNAFSFWIAFFGGLAALLQFSGWRGTQCGLVQLRPAESDAVFIPGRASITTACGAFAGWYWHCQHRSEPDCNYR